MGCPFSNRCGSFRCVSLKALAIVAFFFNTMMAGDRGEKYFFCLERLSMESRDMIMRTSLRVLAQTDIAFTGGP